MLNLSVKYGRKTDCAFTFVNIYVVCANLRGNMWITNDNHTNGVKRSARLSDPHHTTTNHIFYCTGSALQH